MSMRGMQRLLTCMVTIAITLWATAAVAQVTEAQAVEKVATSLMGKSIPELAMITSIASLALAYYLGKKLFETMQDNLKMQLDQHTATINAINHLADELETRPCVIDHKIKVQLKENGTYNPAVQ